MGQRGEDRLAKEDMRSAGIGEDGRRGGGAQQGRVNRVFIVGIARFQSGEGVEVGETRDWFGVYNGGKKRKIGMREGRSCVERGKGVDKNSESFLPCCLLPFFFEGAGAEAGGGGMGNKHWPRGRGTVGN